MIYTITFNPSIDYIIQLDQFQEGTINKTTYEQIKPGGKGINVSIVLNKLKHDTCALGFVANSSGNMILDLLDKQKINHHFIQVADGFSRINVKIKSHVESEINGNGPNISSDEVKQLFQLLDHLQHDDLLVISGSIPKCLPNDIYEQILAYLKPKNIKIIVDATKDLLLNVLKYQPFLIKPNHHELGELFNTTIHNQDDAINYAKKLKAMGACNVLVSMANQGAILIDETNNIYKANAFKGEVVNSIGAGDSMVAGFISGYLQTNDYAYALKKGIACGCASTFSNELVPLDLLKQFLGN